MWEYRAMLAGNPAAAVHDGDTVKLLIDLGFDARVEKWVRLADVRAPELSQIGGAEARSYVIEWLTVNTGRFPPEYRWPLRVCTEITRKAEPTEITSLNRYVGWIYSTGSGECLNEAITAFLGTHPDWPSGKDLAQGLA